MYRDFSENSKNKLLGLVSEVESEKWCDFTDWVGDRWLDFESWIGTLNIKGYVNNVNSYHKKVIDKNNATKKSIEEIFSNVAGVDSSFQKTFDSVEGVLKGWQNYIDSMANIVSPTSGSFNADFITKSLSDAYSSIQRAHVDVVKQQLKQEVNGEIVYDTEAFKKYMQMKPEELSDAEKLALLEIVNELSELNAYHTTILELGDENAAAYIGYLSNYEDEEEAYYNFILAGGYYNDAYLKILNIISETGEDGASWAAQLLNFGNDNFSAGILGVECSAAAEAFIGSFSASAGITGYIAKIETEHSEIYAGKVSIEGEVSGSTNVKIKDVYKKKQDQIFNDSTVYDPETGTFIKCGKDDYKALKEKAKLAGVEVGVGVEASILEGTLSGESEYASGSVSAKVGTAHADASIGVGLYVYDDSGNKLIAPTVKAEVGVGVSALNVSANGTLGTDDIGVYGKGSADVLEAEAEASAKFTVFDEKGKLDIQAGISASAEANLVEASGSAGVTVLGADVGVSGSVKVGIGAHADIGYVDGHLKVDVGAALGVGVSVGFDIDVGGLVDGVATKVSESWSDISSAASNAWNGFKSWFK